MKISQNVLSGATFLTHTVESLVESELTALQTAVASLGWVTPGAASEGVTPLFFPEKPGDLFLVASSAVSPMISSSQNLTTFFAHRFIAFYCFHSGVTPLEGVTLHLFTCPTSFLRYSL